MTTVGDQSRPCAVLPLLPSSTKAVHPHAFPGADASPTGPPPKLGLHFVAGYSAGPPSAPRRIRASAALALMPMPDTNLFTRKSALQSEADVEACFVDRLLSRLGYPDDAVRRKHSLNRLTVPQGHVGKLYRPDYVLYDGSQRPVVVIEAKSPMEDPSDFHYQVSGYALGINQSYEDDDNPIRFVAVTNGLRFLLWPWASNVPVIDAKFSDFQEDNSNFLHLRSIIA